MNEDDVIKQRVSGRSAYAIAKAHDVPLFEASRILDRYAEASIIARPRKHAAVIRDATDGPGRLR